MTAILAESASLRRPLFSGLLALVGVLALSAVLASNPGDTLTRNTIRLSLAWYFAALCLMMQMRGADWTATTPLGSLARWCWTWGVLCFLVHLAMAFHHFHHWSHTHALEHTREVSGVGEGVYVSYLFTLVWLADAAWWWCWPGQYAARSAWIDRTLQTFMLFMVFNGMVVFESGPIRWVGVFGFVALSALWILLRTTKCKDEG